MRKLSNTHWLITEAAKAAPVMPHRNTLVVDERGFGSSTALAGRCAR
jgi:hypothetical protein